MLVEAGVRRALLRAAAAHRSEAAFDWLLDVVTSAREPIALDAIEALALYRHNEKLRDRLRGAVEQRVERALHERFAELWH